MRIILLICLLGLAIPAPAMAAMAGYTVKAQVHFRAAPSMRGAVIRTLDQNESLTLLEEQGEWFKAATLSGTQGFVHRDTVSTLWIKVHKLERRLLVMDSGRAIREYRIALCPFNPLGDKAYQGDGGTPEGRFFVCESLRDPGQAKYGARSMRLSYPSAEDARRGLHDGRITYQTYAGIVRAVRNGLMPSQSTPLGGSIRIHGGGNGQDWTLGCLGMDDKDIEELFDLVPAKARVDIFTSADQEKALGAGLATRVLEGANAQLEHPALYSDYACGLVRMPYPAGDIREADAVCTDVVIRALRHAGLDLQALLHEDILTHPARYSRWVKNADTNIDHRRTRNLHTWLTYHALALPLDYETFPGTFDAGDILTMDTGIPNGTPLDHIGLVHTSRHQGVPLVFNIWTTGCTTSLMRLLGSDYPTIQGHFRLAHPFEYR